MKEKKIFILEDDPGMLALMQAILEPHYRVCCFERPNPMLEQITKERPNLLILDLMLPDLDGRSIQMALYKSKATQRIPIIICTALANTKRVFEGQLNVVAFVHKPVLPNDLLQVVQQALETSSARR